MTYSCTRHQLLSALALKCPKEAQEIRETWYDVSHGLLSVGLKIHIGSQDYGSISELEELLGDRMSVFENNYYRHDNASFCLVLPPVGNAETAILLIQCLEKFTGMRLLGNAKVIIQVCSPGRLSPDNAALLAISYYVSSPLIRQYKLSDFATSVATDLRFNRGRRLVIYDAEGPFDKHFEWWSHPRSPTKYETLLIKMRLRKRYTHSIISATLPFSHGRSDIFVTTATPLDIRNINLVASLLLHHQLAEIHLGILAKLGEEFRRLLMRLLQDHELAHLLHTRWVEPSNDSTGVQFDSAFYSALQELMNYALSETGRLRQLSQENQRKGILFEASNLVRSFRDSVQSVKKGESI